MGGGKQYTGGLHKIGDLETFVNYEYKQNLATLNYVCGYFSITTGNNFLISKRKYQRKNMDVSGKPEFRVLPVLMVIHFNFLYVV